MDSKYVKDIVPEYKASYAMYVATNRAIASLVDGFKPVHRRCVNSADDLHLYHDRKFLKVSKLEGQVMGDYHPHGGASMSILAQPFKTRYPLFEGQGNWGSPDEPNSVAASRYVETRLTKFCEEFYLSSADYADKEDNYDGRLKEVVRYYPPIPGILLTSPSGIAVGLSTNIPPHRIADVCKSLLSYIKGDKSYLNLIPDTCEESIILTPKEEIKKLYTKGECSIQYKAKTHYESIDGKLALVVDAFPPDYRKKSLETSLILDAVESGNLELKNESSTGIRYVFTSKDKGILEAIEDRLVSSVGYRMYIEHNNQIHLYKLEEIYDQFIESRKVYIERKYSDLIEKNRTEMEYIRVLLLLKKDKEYLKSMFDKSPKEVAQDLVQKYATTLPIANRVISSSLTSMMKDNSEKLMEKFKELEAEIQEYRTYTENPIIKIKMDIEKLYNQYKNEERRAIHIDDVKDVVSFKYKGTTIETNPSSVFFVATKENKIDIKHAAELTTLDLSDYIIISDEYEYYVLHDNQGLVAMTKDQMLRLDNKFKSDSLVDIVGTNDLSTIEIIRSNNKRKIMLGDWALRSRVSYIQQVEGDASIKLAQH